MTAPTDMPQSTREAELMGEIIDAQRQRDEARKMLQDHLGQKFATHRDIQNTLLTQMCEAINSPLTRCWERPLLRWAMRKLVPPTWGA